MDWLGVENVEDLHSVRTLRSRRKWPGGYMKDWMKIRASCGTETIIDVATVTIDTLGIPSAVDDRFCEAAHSPVNNNELQPVIIVIIF
mmetsp:Transcript_2772/g.4012  ORF Transcript_2772/g.4012 Transcript_2772/m.4012 type:complete len:88 (-) Transcript_2772:292-555(-)